MILLLARLQAQSDDLWNNPLHYGLGDYFSKITHFNPPASNKKKAINLFAFHRSSQDS